MTADALRAGDHARHTLRNASNKARLSAAAYRRACAAGEITKETAILECRESMTLRQLLCSFHRWALVKSERLARDADVVTLDIPMGGSRNLRSITMAERERLVDALHGNRTPRARAITTIARRESDEDLMVRLVKAGCNVDQVARFFSISPTNASTRIWQARQRMAA